MKTKIFILAVLLLSLIVFTGNARCEMLKTKTIDLPKPKIKGAMSLEESIQKRRSVRSYSSKELSMEQISQLLWACQGITDERRELRAAPSAGALYPLEIYLVKKDGFYHYVPKGHKLEVIKSEDLRPALAKASWGQSFVEEAPINIIICAVYSRISSRYGPRATRYTDIEVGHAAQNVHLEAVSLGLASVPVGAYNDNDVKKILDLPANEEPIYIIPVGYGR